MTKNELTYINRRTVEAHGGNFVPPNNFLHEENLDYLLEVVQAEMFGQPVYPTLADKAEVYFFNVIGNHIFRTATSGRASRPCCFFSI